MQLVYLFTCVIIIKAQVDERDFGGYEAKLHQDVFRFYTAHDKSTRPSNNSNEPTHLSFGISLISVFDVDPLTHSILSCIWHRMDWTDYRLRWNSDDYGGVNVIRFPPKLVWTPDVLLLNDLESSDSEIAHFKSNMLVYPEGYVLWVPSSTYRTICAIDLYSFPYDTHVCSWVYRAWSNEGKDLRFVYYGNKKLVDFSDLWKNAEWEVEIAEFQFYTENDSSVHKSIAFSIRLRRRSYFYVFTLLVPITMSWLLTFILFCIPTDLDWRIFLASLNIFYLQLITILLQWILPSNGNFAPRIVLFCGQSTIFAAISALFSMILVAMNKCVSPPRLPACLKNALNGWLGRNLILDRHSIRGASLGSRLLTSSNLELNVNQCDKNYYDEIHENWMLLISALNRFVFILYCVSFTGVVIATRLSF